MTIKMKKVSVVGRLQLRPDNTIMWRAACAASLRLWMFVEVPLVAGLLFQVAGRGVLDDSGYLRTFDATGCDETGRSMDGFSELIIFLVYDLMVNQAVFYFVFSLFRDCLPYYVSDMEWVVAYHGLS